MLESGAGITAAVPVVEGYALQKTIVRSSFTGDMLTEVILLLTNLTLH